MSVPPTAVRVGFFMVFSFYNSFKRHEGFVAFATRRGRTG
jgi:hypothetical protein